MKQPVHLRIMDSSRAPVLAELEVSPLSHGRRVMRGVQRLAIVSGVSAVVLLLPLLHLCGALGVLVAGPVAAALAYRVTVLCLGAQQVPCPKCAAAVSVTDGATGWPLRVHCQSCGSSVEGRPASSDGTPA